MVYELSNGLFKISEQTRNNLLTNKVSPTLIAHRLDIQMLRIRAERAGWTNWISADFGREIVKSSRVKLLNPFYQSQCRPDARPHRGAWCGPARRPA